MRSFGSAPVHTAMLGKAPNTSVGCMTCCSSIASPARGLGTHNTSGTPRPTYALITHTQRRGLGGAMACGTSLVPAEPPKAIHGTRSSGYEVLALLTGKDARQDQDGSGYPAQSWSDSPRDSVPRRITGNASRLGLDRHPTDQQSGKGAAG